MRLAPAEIPKGTALVYALVSNGRVRYVGQTANPAKRHHAHSLSTMAGLNFRMLEVRRVPTADALRIERQVIRAFQRKGQAELNGTGACSHTETCSRVTISMPQAIADMASKSAAKQNRTFSNYIAWLITQDKP